MEGSSMADTKWDKLNNDCLIQIFSKVETKSLVRFVPYVCKSWYHATLDPQCWRTLTFHSGFDPDNFVKYAVGRAERSATIVVFEPCLYPNSHDLLRRLIRVTRQELLCIAEGCPLLKTLILPNYLTRENRFLLSKLIVNWNHLEYLQIFDATDIYCFEKILESISLHCLNFVGFVCNNTEMGTEQVSAIVKFTPKIKFLRIQYSVLPHECLVMLLKGCSTLETLDVRGCIGFEEDDDEIVTLSSNLDSFNCTGASLDNIGENSDYYESDTDADYDKYNS